MHKCAKRTTVQPKSDSIVMTNDLHEAIKASDESEVVQSMASRCDINEVNQYGDQPAHVAARYNRLECMKILIINHANMNRKNYNGLTPLGEAQMNGNSRIVALIKENYALVEAPEYSWDEEIQRECAGWFQSYDHERQIINWVRFHGNKICEISYIPPPIDMKRVLNARQYQTNGKRFVRRIHPNSLRSQTQMEYERQMQLEEEKLKISLIERSKLVEERCATRLQKRWRKLKAARYALQRRREIAAANRIQRR